MASKNLRARSRAERFWIARRGKYKLMPPTVSSSDAYEHSQAFIVRVWQESLGNGEIEWRGRVQSVRTGQSLYFREWSLLLDFLQGDSDGSNTANQGGETNVKV